MKRCDQLCVSIREGNRLDRVFFDYNGGRVLACRECFAASIRTRPDIEMNRLEFAESFPEPHLLVDSSGGIVSANKAFLDWASASAPADAGAANLLSLFADRQRVLGFLRRCVRSRRLVPANLRLQARFAEGTLACEGARFGAGSEQMVLLRLSGPRGQARRVASKSFRRRRGALSESQRAAVLAIGQHVVRIGLGGLDQQQCESLHQIQELIKELLPPTDVRMHEPSRDEQERGRSRSRQAIRVLLVEDNAVNRVVASRMLGRLGLTPDVCSDGFEAVERASEQSYDLILMDLQMPKMDGLEATHRIRALQSGQKAARIVALTANTLDEVRQACQSAGMDAFLAKPFTLDELRALLDSLFQPPRG